MVASKKRYVEIVPTKGGGFELYENGRATQELIFNKDYDRIDKKKMKKADDYRILFFLDEKGGYKFVLDKSQVMLIDGAPCPYPPGRPEFEVDDVDDYELEVLNRDSRSASYKFTINLLDGAGNHVAYDPIYSNQNGGT